MGSAQAGGAVFASVGDHDALGTALKEDLQDIWLDRDRSWLQFNERVLAEAFDERTPLLERVKFLAIVTSNADEFFMKRLSVLREGENREAHLLLHSLKEQIVKTLAAQAKCWSSEILPALEEHGLSIRYWADLTPEQQAEANNFFDHQVSPALTPLVMNSGESFPFLSNLSTSLVFTVSDPETDEPLFVRIKVPRELKHWVSLKAGTEAGGQVYVRLHEIIQSNLGKLYPNMTIKCPALVRITRDAEVEAEESEGSTIKEVRRQVRQRRYEPVVRLEFTQGVDSRIRNLLTKNFKLSPDDVYDAPDGLDCSTLFEVAGINVPALKDKPWTPLTPPALEEQADLFAVIRTGDLLVHHPYESFDGTVERFVTQAAADPNVIAIKMTVYRVGDDTPFVRSLIKAAEMGKQVACVIELRARFDEERNLHWADTLVQAGAHISFGVKGLKIHGKMALVVRKESDGIRTYVHIGTGNYHTKTARLYADVGLFTCDESITADGVALFHYLTGHSKPPEYKTLLVAPLAMRNRFLELIERETQHARDGRPARIIAKMNQLEDPEIIEALSKASEAGVSVDLIIRGFCCLRPGVKGKTENIRIRSLIGRFLEHSRIYYFANGAQERIDGDFYIGSADWMYRNLSKRIEVATPVKALGSKQKLTEILDLCLNDVRQTWLLNEDGNYGRLSDEHGETTDDPGIHERLMKLTLERSSVES
jgi:polyphosphate kinase